MKAFISYVKDFFRHVSLPAFITIILFLSLLVILNYTLGIERRMIALHPWYLSIAAFYLFFGAVFFSAWGLQTAFSKEDPMPASTSTGDLTTHGTASALSFSPRLLTLLLLAPFYFACKMVHWDLSFLVSPSVLPPWDRYIQVILQLPAKLLLLLLFIYMAWKTRLLSPPSPDLPVSLAPSVGLTTRNFNARPYFYLLLMLVPLIALASTRPDFLRVYPKVRTIAFLNGHTGSLAPWKLLYELSYGLDFLSIELFFRGLLVVGLARYAGAKAILPMAAFYCTIHFGKPLGECISSFFGGLVLGILAFRTRSILGGLTVHLGLAWMMEIGGWLGAAI